MDEEPPLTSNPALRLQLARLRAAFVHRRPFCQGATTLPREDGMLFYGKGPQEGSCIDLTNASLEELRHLAETCDPASFGIQQKDVYDESYRKAGKLDKGNFAINISPDALGIVDAIRDELLVEARSRREPIRAELYKLNVYGPQSFFKAHVDTPRSELMFGSLVITFPTLHEGGALVLRDDGDDGDTKGVEGGPGTECSGDGVKNANGRREWTIDSAALLAQCATPSIAYVAFFSDIEHEVMPVLSGYRVTLTYNLYYVQDVVGLGDAGHPSIAAQPVMPSEDVLRSTLRAMLDDPTFLPSGGNLLFGLHHRYPLSTSSETRWRYVSERQKELQDVASRLKGSDAMLLRAARSNMLDTEVRMVFEDDCNEDGDTPEYVMCDHDPNLHAYVFDTYVAYFLQERGRYGPGGVLVDPHAQDPANQVHWIGSMPWLRSGAVNSAEYLAYGNAGSVEYVYWRLALLVPVGPYGKRETRNDEDGTVVQR
ncbi:hypothetical protein GY45DRAFT_1359215 [Cubamyces sp. BRFM 1775]|nr:hypothetical protein GY45DRAFT_1359215 [Cubamyces sp. BRFM 1775]